MAVNNGNLKIVNINCPHFFRGQNSGSNQGIYSPHGVHV